MFCSSLLCPCWEHANKEYDKIDVRTVQYADQTLPVSPKGEIINGAALRAEGGVVRSAL
jgi:hypothetical protein